MARDAQPHAPHREEGGFTLVEMVIAISVLAVVLLGVGGVLASGLRALAAAKSRSQANEIATQGIEDLQRFSFNNLGLCGAPGGTQPAGLETTVSLPNCGATPAYEEPCNGLVGTVPKAEYTCTRNNIAYTVKRYVAWADSLLTTKRLAVFVEWDDLTGRHQVSQQSSLRAPDQAAITGLAPPRFDAVANNPTATPQALAFDAAGYISSGSINLSAVTSNLSKPASTTLNGAVPTHTADDTVTINVASSAQFPVYNGFPITVGWPGATEAMTVLAGAGTNTWTVRTTASTTIPSGAPVNFGGDKVFATFQTIASNGSPQWSTAFLPNTTGNTWSGTISAADGFRFGFGSQHIAFGILRASDGKATAAYATPAVSICPPSGCDASLALPTVTIVQVPTSVSIGTGGELASDVTVTVRTTNVTAVDSVTLGFQTSAGSVTVQLTPDTACPPPATATPGVECTWTGTISRAAGYRFNSGSQQFFFAAAQIDDADPLTLDNGSTGVPSGTPPTVAFG